MNRNARRLPKALLATLLVAGGSGALVVGLTTGARQAFAQGGIWTGFVPAGTTVRDVGPGADGTVLVAGGSSFFEMDGVRLRRLPVDSPDEHLLFPSRVLRARNGDLWLGTGSHGLFLLTPDSVLTRYTKSSGLGNSSNDEILALVEGLDGSIWAGTHGGGLSRFNGTTWTTLTTVQGLPTPFIQALAVDPRDGSIWAGAATDGALEGGLVHVVGGVTITTFRGLPALQQDVYSTLVTTRGEVWAGFREGLARLESGGTFAPYLLGPQVNAVALAEGAQGEIWFGTLNRGAGYLLGDTWRMITPNPLSPLSTSVHVDSAGVFWVGSQGGLSRFEGAPWLGFLAGVNMPGGFTARAITRDLSAAARGDSIDAQGIVWIGHLVFGPGEVPGSLGGESLLRFANGRHRFLGAGTGLPNGSVRALEPVGDGRVWVGIASNNIGGPGGLALVRADGSVERIFQTADGLPSNRVVALAAVPGGVWAATETGVGFCDGNTVRALPTGVGRVPDSPIRGLHVDGFGRLWIATGPSAIDPVDQRPPSGAVLFNPADSSYVRLDVAAGLPTNALTSVRVFSNADVWFGSTAGAIRYRAGGIQRFGVVDGLPDDSVLDIGEGAFGRVWVATGAGLALYDGANWNSYNASDGLAGNEVQNLFVDSLGVAAACAVAGASLFHPDETPPTAEILTGPAAEVGTRDVQLSVRGGDLDSGTRDLSLSYQIDNQAETPFVEDLVVINANQLADADHVVRLWAKDRGLNVSRAPVEWHFTVDATAPRPIVERPAFNEIVKDTVDVIGNVNDARFAFYLVELRPQGRALWDTIYVSPTPPPPGEPIYRWDTKSVLDGVWELRVGTNDRLGLTGYVQVTVIVDNLAPSASSTSPATVDHVQGGRVFTTFGEVELYVPPNAWPSDQIVTIDSVAISDSLRGAGWVKSWAIDAELDDLSKPATVTVQLPGVPAGAPVALYRVGPNQSLTPVGGVRAADGLSLSTSISSLGTFAVKTGDAVAGSGFKGVQSLDCQPRVLTPGGGGFDTETAISFELGHPGDAAIKVFDQAGRLVREIVESGQMPAGRNVVTWDGKDGDGAIVASGLYLVAVRFDGETQVKTVVVANK